MKLKMWCIAMLGGVLLSSLSSLHARTLTTDPTWKAQWISSSTTAERPNTWLNFRKKVELPTVPTSVIARIAADSKYWLWINGKMVVFEGQLKRGPNPLDTYYDEVELAPYLHRGENTIAVLLWYFGRPSFSHNDSGKAGLLFDCQTASFEILSDESWKCEANPAFGTSPGPDPNMRLAESNILYDARKETSSWIEPSFKEDIMPQAVVNGPAGGRPWNKLVVRPIPLWKVGALQDYTAQQRRGDTLVCTLPYNAQVTPYIKLKAEAGGHILIFSDNYLKYNGGDNYLRCEYITRDGLQEYENLGWTNGHRIYYVLPKGVEVVSVKFRESGYNAEFTSTFECSDPLFNRFHTKALRTLYLTMRDTYMDCPDRERSQWTGDATNESGEAFYVLSKSSDQLTRKWLLNLAEWQKSDSVIYAPVPASNWDKELPGQVMASLGYYGLWNYYWYTKDQETLEKIYPAVKRYIGLWKKGPKGTVLLRAGGWNWGDWGTDIDIVPLQNCWYYLMIKGMRNSAQVLGYTAEAKAFESEMAALKSAFNAHFWNGSAYRNPEYTKQTDDRVQALAVVAGLANPDKYPSIMNVLRSEEHASPYMEKYVFEAMVQMGYGAEGFARHNRRFANMVQNDYFSTLFEGWGIGNEGFGGGSVNHAWSGGGITIAYQYLCGIQPLKPAYELIGILPLPSGLEWAKASVETPVGRVFSAFENSNNVFVLNAELPKSQRGVLGVPQRGVREVKINGETVWRNGSPVRNRIARFSQNAYSTQHLCFEVKGGSYKVIAVQ
ncbi:MAG: alpha-L-rhamnosidase C-terminal domain-containing protein [Alistipes sp.]|nr:alpha-L-rhamnosidase C-terminal domain-containing protein [Alistipes sp.]